MKKPYNINSFQEQNNEIKNGKEHSQIYMTTDIRNEAKITLTKSGQITFPAKLIKGLGLKKGDQLHFKLLENGQILVEPVKLLAAEELFGMFDRPEDKGNFTLDLQADRNERADNIIKDVK